MNDPHRGRTLNRPPSPGGDHGQEVERVPAPLLARLPSPVYAFSVVVLGFAKYGAGVFVSSAYLVALARNWRDPHQAPLLRPPADYLLSSPTSAVVAGVAGLHSDGAFHGFHLVLAVAALVVPFATSVVRQSPTARLAVAILLVGGPITAVLLSWVGSYDPVTLLAAAPAALSPLAPVRALGWMLFAFNNAPQAAIAFVVLAVVMWPEIGFSRAVRAMVPGAIGGALGYVAIQTLTWVWGGSTSRVDWFGGSGTSLFFQSASNYFPIILFSSLGIGWFLLLHPRLRSRPGVRVLLGAAVVLSCTLPLVVLDQSRVVALVLWPALLWMVVRVATTMEPSSVGRLLVRWAPAAVLTPIMLVWSNQLVYPGWRSLAALVRLVL